MRLLSLLLLGLSIAMVLTIDSSAEAACSGSGLTWTCTAGTTSGELASALSSASDGATFTFSSGTYSWNSFVSFSNSKGATLICATEGGCTVTLSQTVLGMNGNCAGINTRFYRISGFVFSGGSIPIWFHAYDTGGCTLQKLRIDHNRFIGQVPDTRILYFGENAHNAYFYGVVDHNTVTNSSNVVFAEFLASNGADAPAGTRGTANNLFFEDNTVTITTMTNAGAGCLDSTGSPGIVWRFNTTTNCLLTAHGTTGGGGVVNYEVYGNRFIVNSGANGAGFGDCFRCFHHQGSGEFIAFNNTFTPYSGHSENAIAMTHYRSAPPSVAGYSGQRCDGTASGDGNRSGQLGYPCKRQPGRDVNAVLQPMYIWGNKWTDNNSMVTMYVESGLWGETNPSVSDHIKANRDYYNSVSASPQSSPTSPFNGTTGMGFGTLANRPTTCTPTPQAADAGKGGVGYFATNDGAQGTLYRCSAANIWTAHYTPYTYPHPIVGGGAGGGSASTPPSPPSNLTVQ